MLLIGIAVLGACWWAGLPWWLAALLGLTSVGRTLGVFAIAAAGLGNMESLSDVAQFGLVRLPEEFSCPFPRWWSPLRS